MTMYGYINGIIKKISPKYVIIENNGIGYILLVSNPYSFRLNETMTIFTYQHVREDVIELYGFKLEEEKDLFVKLISVSGIGPKTALSILASGTVKEIISAIETRNDAYLRKFPGIGTKASQQIILDLKGKLVYDEIVVTNTTKLEDVENALVALGYKKNEITKVLAKVDTTLDQGDMIKACLKYMIK